MILRKTYTTLMVRDVVAAEGWPLIIGVPSWEDISSAELWLRLADRDLPGIEKQVLLYLKPDSALLEATVPPSRLMQYTWSADPWPIEQSTVFASVPQGEFTVVGPPTEEVWEMIVAVLGVP